MSDYNSSKGERKRKRNPRERSKDENDESNQFWINNKYFQEGSQDEVSEDYEPEPNKLLKQNSEDSSNQNDDLDDLDDFIDSQMDDDGNDLSFEDEEDDIQNGDQDSSEDPVPQLQPQQDDLFVELIKQNIASFSFKRGIHSYLNIKDLKRLGASSYLQYNSKDTYSDQKNINRIYIGVPLTEGPKPQYDEQERTKTDFHGMLFKYEDQRYEIDHELKQLSYIIKNLQRNILDNLSNIKAYRSLIINKSVSKEDQIQIIQKRIEFLQSQKGLQNYDLERTIFYQTLEEKFYLLKKEEITQLTRRKLQEELYQRIEIIENCLSNPSQEQILAEVFKAKGSYRETIILEQWQQDYHQYENTLIPPTIILSLKEDLQQTIDLIRFSISLDQKQPDHQYMSDVFEDIVQIFPIPIKPTKFSLDLDSLPTKALLAIKLDDDTIKTVLSQSKMEPVGKQNKCEESFSTVVDSRKVEHVPSKIFQFYPFTNKSYLIGRPVLSFIFQAFHQIKQRVNLLESALNNTFILVNNIQFQLFEIIVEIIKRSLTTQIQEVQLQEILRRLLPEQVVVSTLGLIFTLYQIKKILASFQYDSISMKLFCVWCRSLPTSKTMGEQTKLLQNSAQEDILEGIVDNLKSERCGMCRVQIIGDYLTIHNFDLMKSKHQEQEGNGNENSSKQQDIENSSQIQNQQKIQD